MFHWESTRAYQFYRKIPWIFVGFTVCTVSNSLSPQTLDQSEEKLAILKNKQLFTRRKIRC